MTEPTPTGGDGVTMEPHGNDAWVHITRGVFEAAIDEAVSAERQRFVGVIDAAFRGVGELGNPVLRSVRDRLKSAVLAGADDPVKAEHADA